MKNVKPKDSYSLIQNVAPRNYEENFMKNFSDKNSENDSMITYDNLTRENIQAALARGDVQTDRYIYLLLYNQTDAEQFQLISDYFTGYGAALNNRLGEDVPLFTVYSENDYKAWQKTLKPALNKKLAEQFNSRDDVEARYSLLLALARDYQVNTKLPALIIIDGSNTAENSETYTAISFKDLSSADAIYKRMAFVLGVVDEHQNDFYAICDECGTTRMTKDKKLADILDNLYDFVDKRLHQKKESMLACAGYVGCSRTTLRKWLNGENRIPLERAFSLALFLELTGEELDYLLKYTTITPAQKLELIRGGDKRYNAIRECLSKKMCDEDLNIYLKDHKLLPTIEFDKPKDDEYDDDDK